MGEEKTRAERERRRVKRSVGVGHESNQEVAAVMGAGRWTDSGQSLAQASIFQFRARSLAGC
jgi:hypothetical protein